MARSLCVFVPSDVSESIHRIGQAKVWISVNGHETQTVMLQGTGGSHFIKLSAGFRKLAGIYEGEGVTVKLALREEEPSFDPPEDFEEALRCDAAAMERWTYLPYRQKKAHVDYIAAAGKTEFRARRIRKVVEALAG